MLAGEAPWSCQPSFPPSRDLLTLFLQVGEFLRQAAIFAIGTSLHLDARLATT